MTSRVDGESGRECLPFRRKLPRKRVMSTSEPDVTLLLRRWSEGDEEALNRLVPLVYGELRRWPTIGCNASRRTDRSIPPGSCMTRTEACRRPVGTVRDRAHFLSMASRVMRRLLVDQGRARRASKRGGGAEKVELDEAFCVSEPQAERWPIWTMRCNGSRRSTRVRARLWRALFRGIVTGRDR